MRLNAYVLAGDPAWIEQSVQSYYGLVDRLVVSYDRSHRSWSGHPLSVQESLSRLQAIDPDGKLVLLPGDHTDPSRPPLATETEHRQAALDAASDGADWVIQLDTDEIMASPRVFTLQLHDADRRAARALDYPSRLFYARSKSGVFLETCGRWWTTQAAFPGPLAVRAGTPLTHARQASTSPTYRVDVAAWNTDPMAPQSKPVHAIIHPRDAVLHMSWVRTPQQMAEKSRVSGYASAHDWDREITAWVRRSRHPHLAALAAPFARDPIRRFRVAHLAEFAEVPP
jgi:hypothetical protein